MEIFHENLIKNNGITEIKSENETNLEQNIPMQNSISKGSIKIEIKQEDDDKNRINKFSNCNYYYDNETYVISDDDDEDDEEDLKEIIIKKEITNFLQNNDTIEISDDEMDINDQDEINIPSTTPRFIKAETKTDDFVTTNSNPFNMFSWMTPRNIEGIYI